MKKQTLVLALILLPLLCSCTVVVSDNPGNANYTYSNYAEAPVYMVKEVNNTYVFYGTKKVEVAVWVFKSDGSIIRSGQPINGICKWYYKPNVIKQEITYSNNVRYGNYKNYYDSGDLREEGYYMDGVRNGRYKFYQKKGIVEDQGTYNNGKRQSDKPEFKFKETPMGKIEKWEYQDAVERHAKNTKNDNYSPGNTSGQYAVPGNTGNGQNSPFDQQQQQPNATPTFVRPQGNINGQEQGQHQWQQEQHGQKNSNQTGYVPATPVTHQENGASFSRQDGQHGQKNQNHTGYVPPTARQENGASPFGQQATAIPTAVPITLPQATATLPVVQPAEEINNNTGNHEGHGNSYKHNDQEKNTDEDIKPYGQEKKVNEEAMPFGQEKKVSETAVNYGQEKKTVETPAVKAQQKKSKVTIRGKKEEKKGNTITTQAEEAAVKEPGKIEKEDNTKGKEKVEDKDNGKDGDKKEAENKEGNNKEENNKEDNGNNQENGHGKMGK